MNFIDLPQMLAGAGAIRLPGSKSISNRVLLLAALAQGETSIRDLLASDDTARMQEALRALGVKLEECGAGAIRVQGCAGAFPVRQAELFLGNAGTAFRTLTAVLALALAGGALAGGDFADDALASGDLAGGALADDALANGNLAGDALTSDALAGGALAGGAPANGGYILKGVPRMHERPIGDLVDALRQLGAQIDYLEKPGYPPLRIHPAIIRPGGRVRIRGDVSSQFLTGLLMALPLTGVETTVVVEGELISRPYVEMTLNLMARFGVTVARQGWQSFTVPAQARYRAPTEFRVESDASSASYFLALGAIGALGVQGGDAVRVEGVGRDSIQGDVRFADALAQMGATIEMGTDWIAASAPAKGRLQGVALDCNHIPDAAMTLAVLALFAEGETTLANIASWRVKETDRIAAMAKELGKLGARVEEGGDYLKITPPDAAHPLRPAVIDTYDDHRMAMCFSLASFAVPLRINDPACTAKTFPDYFPAFKRIARPAPVIAIDGPTASGKGAVASRVAAALGFHYLDSGALYRLTALAAQRAGVDWADEAGVAAIAANLDVAFAENSVRLNGEEVGAAIRSEAISAGASKVAALPAVRAALLFRQRAFHRAPGLVGDGRDMASVVFTDAPLKIFLTASAQVRADRRYRQLQERGEAADRNAILADLEARDQRDRDRPVAPLRQAPDARLLDTDALNIEAAVAQVLTWWSEAKTAA